MEITIMLLRLFNRIISISYADVFTFGTITINVCESWIVSNRIGTV